MKLLPTFLLVGLLALWTGFPSSAAASNDFPEALSGICSWKPEEVSGLNWPSKLRESWELDRELVGPYLRGTFLLLSADCGSDVSRECRLSIKQQDYLVNKNREVVGRPALQKPGRCPINDCSCVMPEPDKCQTDHQCRNNQKCCYYCCSKQCVNPAK